MQCVHFIFLHAQGIEFAKLKFKKVKARFPIRIGRLEIVKSCRQRLPFSEIAFGGFAQFDEVVEMVEQVALHVAAAE